MVEVKFFKYGPVIINSDLDHDSIFQNNINVFLTGLSVTALTEKTNLEIRAINGPYVAHIHSDKEHSFERVIYTANVIYEITPK